MRRHALLIIATFLFASPAAAQGPAWNSARALELVERARQRRLLPQADSTLRNYRARAEGFVYFYLDRTATDERTLVKTDQIALEFYWAQPNRTKQRIVGLRDESRLPNRMHYHLDHLTVVQNGFGNTIRMGDGDEVRDVPHPAAPGSDTVYDFRVADSMELRLPSAPAPIRVYEINVRPRRNDRSAFVGSIFVDRATADIVRMTFTFTPASYVDRRLDYIHISLDNGLWDGRYWLPNEQQLEIRRQIPELDFVAGAVIKGRMRITDYTFNDSLPPTLFSGYPVEAVPHRMREAYPFEREIYDDLEEAGLAPPPEMARLREQAAELLRTRRLSGLPPLRFHLPNASAALRFNRAEGLFLGGGATYAPGGPGRLDGTLGYAFGAEHLSGGVTYSQGSILLQGYANQPRDLGVNVAVAPALNTISAALLGDDYFDLFFASGVRAQWRRTMDARLHLDLAVSAERQRSATLAQRHPPFDDSASYRPVRPIDDGDELSVAARLLRPMPDGPNAAWSASADLELGSLASRGYARAQANATARLRNAYHTRTLQVNALAGITSRGAAQHLFLLGGAGTLPGFDYRSFAGERYALLQAEASQAVIGPWLRLRLTGAAGVTGGLDTRAPHSWSTWGVRETDNVQFSVGAGVSLFWDILRIDRVRGLGEHGRWTFHISASPDFADIS